MGATHTKDEQAGRGGGDGLVSFLDACNCSMGPDACMVSERRMSASTTPSLAYTPKSRDELQRTRSGMHSSLSPNAGSVGKFQSPRIEGSASDLPRSESVNNMIKFNESPAQSPRGDSAEAPPSPKSPTRNVQNLQVAATERRSSVKHFLRFDDDENAPSESLSMAEANETPRTKEARARRAASQLLTGKVARSSKLEGFDDGLDPVTGELTITARSPSGKRKTQPAIRQSYHCPVQPTLTKSVEKATLKFFNEKQQVARNQIVNTTGMSDFEARKRAQGLSSNERELIGIIKSKEAHVRAQSETREQVQGNFWNPHTGVARVYSVKAMRSKGFKVVDTRPDMDNLDAIDVVRTAGGNVEGLHSSNEHHHHHHHHHDDDVDVDKLRMKIVDQDDGKAMFDAPITRPKPDDVFGPGTRALREQLRAQRAASAR